VSDRTPDGVYYAWVGLGGFAGGRIIRAGLAAKKAGGDVSYWAWAENRSVRSWPRNPVASALPPAPRQEDIEVGDDDLCEREILIEVRATGRVVVNSPSPINRQLAPVITHGRAPTAEYIVQATPRSRGQGAQEFRGTFTFAGAHLEARPSTGRSGIGWPGEPDFGGTECTDLTCQKLQPQGTRVGPILNRPAAFRVRID
jgi:hypothetical protein